VVAMFGLIYNYLRAVFPNVEEEALLQKHAIVVIDEIDAHLHPTWQQQVLCLCAKRFPNIQFIVAAHSPLVVGGCGAGEAAVLSREGSGFVVKVLPRHFIGATTEEMYREVFKVEQLDSTYKELEALYPKKMEIESQIQALKQKGQSGPELQQLIAQSQGIVQFEEVKEEKDRKALIENENQKLRGDAMDLRARIRRLTDQVSSLQASDEAMLVEIRATMHRDRGGVGLVGGFADGLRKAGRLSEALALVGEAVNLQPDNEIVSKTFEEVLTNFGDHDEAIRVLEGVMKTIGGNKVLQQAVARLKSTGTSESKALEG
jgi:tetratricopeptide (TPR) repeat protein